MSLEDLWRHRWNQEIEFCLEHLPDLNKVIAVQGNEAQVMAQRIEARLLIASLDRARGRTDLFQQQLDSIERDFSFNELNLARHYSFEKGISEWIKDNFISALEHMVRFKSFALNDGERAAALMNEVFCLDNLGFPFQRTLQNLDEILIKNEQNESAPFPGIRNQRRFLDFQNKFRQGQFSFVDLELKADRPLDQSRYFSLWCASLPYRQNFSEKAFQKQIQDLVQKSFFFQKGYRARTLIGNDYQDETESLRVCDLAERLYLWTWRWLSQPNMVNSGLLLSALQSLLKDFQRKSAAPIDLVLVRNALGWISFFCPSFQMKFSPWIREIKESVHSSLGPSASFPILELEWQTLQSFKAEVENQETQRSFQALVENHELFGKCSFLLPEMLKSIQEIKEPQKIPEGTKVLVDLANSEIKLKSGKSMTSESVSRAAALFSLQNKVQVSEFARRIFGIRRYDSFLHQPKVFNLLSRLKDATGGCFDVHLKDGFLYVESMEKKILVLKENPHSESLKSSLGWFKLDQIQPAIEETNSEMRSTPSLRKVEKTALSQFDQKFTRIEIHKLLGGSRASIIRRLNALIHAGKIKRHGKGKSTVYILKKGETLL